MLGNVPIDQIGNAIDTIVDKINTIPEVE